MNEKLSVLKLIGLGFHQLLVNEEVSCDFIVETILNGLPNPGEKIELSAEEIKTMLVFVFELYLKQKKIELSTEEIETLLVFVLESLFERPKR